jgi:hypothetical protein
MLTTYTWCYPKAPEIYCGVITPMQELLKFRNLKERDCATVAERYHVLPPSLPLSLLRVARLRGTHWVAQQ